MTKASQKVLELVENISQVIHGKDEKIKLILGSWIAGGDVLLEDVPGAGKTVLAKSLSLSVSLPFSRVQFTPDLLPSDIIGTTIYDKEKGKFLFRRGPVFSTFF